MKKTAHKKKRQEKIDHIIETATQLFAERGYEGALTDDIADHCGISKRTMYYYTGDKEALYSSVNRRLRDQILAAANFDGISNIDPEEDLKKYIIKIAEIVKIAPAHALGLRALLSTNDSVPEDIPKTWDHTVEVLKKILEKGKKDGLFVEMDPLILLNIIFASFLYWTLITPQLHKADVQMESLNKFGTNLSDSFINQIQDYILRMVLVK